MCVGFEFISAPAPSLWFQSVLLCFHFLIRPVLHTITSHSPRRVPLVAPFLVAAYILDAVDYDPLDPRWGIVQTEEKDGAEAPEPVVLPKPTARVPSQPVLPKSSSFQPMKRVTTHEDL